MKISKVDHTKAAVGKVEKNISGILYVDPTKGKMREDLERRFKQLNEKAQLLYKVFNQINKIEKPIEQKYKSNEEYQIAFDNYELKKRLSTVINNKQGSGLNSVLDKLFFMETYKDNKKRKVLKSVEEVFAGISGKERFEAADVEASISLYLRKSLSKGADDLRVLISAFGKNSVNEDEKVAIENFYYLLKKDFEKIDLSKQIKKSIENQNMLVQPQKNGQASILMLSESTGKGNNALEKQGFHNFLVSFADLEQTKRDDMLRKLSRLVDLYFNAPVAGENIKVEVDSSDFNVWKAHEERKQNEKDFVEITAAIKSLSASKSQADSLKLNNAKQELEQRIRRRNIDCFRYAINAVAESEAGVFFDDENTNRFWIHHIEKAVERILKKLDLRKLYKLKVGYLSEKVWKDILNTISIKYVAIGKSVYNFAMEDLLSEKNERELGKVSSKLANGLTSFDYEMIKADETIQREIAVSVAFAANNLSRAVADVSRANQDEDKSDFLLWKEADIKNYMLYPGEDTTKAILQFFGGQSSWEGTSVLEKAAENDGVDFVYDLKEIIYSLRNESFHFTTARKNTGSWNMQLIGDMFAKEAADCVVFEKKKFYSNNLPLFYASKDLEGLLDFLYSKYHKRATQVPAFNTVCVRKKFPEYLAKTLNCRPNIVNNKSKEQWLSSIYYAMKEVYYNGFVSSDRAKELFNESLYEIGKIYEAERQNKVDGKKNNDARAFADFKKRYEEIKDQSLSQLCQTIMSEYNMQNSGIRKGKDSVKGNKDDKNKAIFQHYKMILVEVLGTAFAKYIKENAETRFLVESIIVKTEYGDMMAEEQFLPGWKSSMYTSFIEEVKESSELQRWYITSHFLNGKLLNQLAGSMRSYVQFVNDIKRRAKQTGNSLYRTETNSAAIFEKNIEMLDICIRLAGKMSNNYQDYFIDEDNYAEYLSNYIDFDNSESMSPAARLEDFCNNAPENIGIYMDGKNPILNRNVVMSKLFGPDQILKEVVKPITRGELEEYYKVKENISNYRVKGTTLSEDEQAMLVDYQRIVNRIELRTITDFGEMINELLGQLIGWSYLRERDLMYFQLGFHYLCLNNENAEKPEHYSNVILNNGTEIKNVILHQIAALYINGIDLVTKEENGFKVEKGTAATGNKIKMFGSYSATILKEEGSEKIDKWSIYEAGLEVFENINEHDNVVKIRNYIEHFHYYSDKKYSLLDLYSEVFDRFFSYDMKYQKNVANMLENILLRYFIIGKTEFGTGEKEFGNGGETKKRAQLGIAESGLSADVFTYKLPTSKYRTDARDMEFKNTVAKILYYPAEVPENIVAKSRRNKAESISDNRTGNGYSKNNKKQKKFDEKSGRDPKGKEHKNTPFAAFLSNYMKDF